METINFYIEYINFYTENINFYIECMIFYKDNINFYKLILYILSYYLLNSKEMVFFDILILNNEKLPVLGLN